MARVRGASLSTEAAQLGFWAVVSRMRSQVEKSGETPSGENGKFSEGEMDWRPSATVVAEIKKRYSGDVEALLLQAEATRRAVHLSNTGFSVSLAGYEKQRRLMAKENALETKAGSAAWPPGGQTLMSRFGQGSWSDAMASFGIAAQSRGRARGSGKHTEEDFLAAVREYVAACARREQAPTYSGYSAWAKAENSAGRAKPSGSAVRQKYRTWSAALNESS